MIPTSMGRDACVFMNFQKKKNGVDNALEAIHGSPGNGRKAVY